MVVTNQAKHGRRKRGVSETLCVVPLAELLFSVRAMREIRIGLKITIRFCLFSISLREKCVRDLLR